MNIAVRTFSGKVVVRPDTTRIKDEDDVWMPEFVGSISWTPVIYGRVCKSGRSIRREFAQRYLDGISAGMLLYPDDLLDGSETAFASASCLDHTTAMRMVFPERNGCSETTIEIKKDGDAMFIASLDVTDTLEDAITEISRFCWLRVGDFVAAELKGREWLCKRGDAVPHIRGRFGETETINFKIFM